MSIYILTESGNNITTEDTNRLIIEGVLEVVSGGMIFPRPEVARRIFDDDEDMLILFHLNQMG
jgi:hypothetical protein